MKRFSLSLSTVFLMLLVQNTQAQYFNFSQYGFADQRINPAIVGIGDYWRFSGVHRQQNTGPDFDIQSTALSASYPLVRPNNGGILGGLGLSLLDDKAGQGKAFKVQEVGLTYAMQVQTGRYQQFAIGASVFSQTRRFSFDDFITNSQYIPDRGFDTSLDPGEPFDELRRSFKRINLGLYLENTAPSGLRASHFGISVVDLNRPSEAFIDSTFRVSATYMLSTGYMMYEYEKMSAYPELLYTRNGNRNLLNLGMSFRYGLANQGALELKGRYLLGREFMAIVQFAKDDFKVGFSYDVPLNRNNTANRGAFEFGFEYRGLVISKTRKRNKKRRDQNPPPDRKTPPKQEKEQGQETESEVAEAEEVKKVEETETEVVEPVVPTEEQEASQEREAETSTGAEGLEYEPFEVETITKRLGFEFNKATLTQEMSTYLDELSDRLKAEPWLKVDVIGHTDDVGNQEVNQRLSLARANAVRRYLVSKGIAAKRITTEGRGETDPISPDQDEKGRALNRRVELVIHR